MTINPHRLGTIVYATLLKGLLNTCRNLLRVKFTNLARISNFGTSVVTGTHHGFFEV